MLLPLSSQNPFYPIFMAFKEWLGEQVRLTDITQETYLLQIHYLLQYLVAFDITAFKAIDEGLIHRFVHYRKDKQTGEMKTYSKAYVEKRLAILDFFFSWAYHQGHCHENPVLRYKKAQLKSRPLVKPAPTELHQLAVLTEEEITRLQALNAQGDECRLRNQCIVLLILASALYASDLIALTARQFHLRAGYILLEEAGISRRVPLNLALCQTLGQQWLKVRKRLLGPAQQPLLFFNQSLQPLSKRLLYQIVAQTLEEAGIHKDHNGPDMLRQTAICQLLAIYPVETVKQVTGLKNLDHYQQALQLQKISDR